MRLVNDISPRYWPRTNKVTSLPRTAWSEFHLRSDCLQLQLSSSPHLNYVATNFMFLGKMTSSNSQAPRTLAPATIISPLANDSAQETVVKPIRKRTNACEACKKRKTKV